MTVFSLVIFGGISFSGEVFAQSCTGDVTGETGSCSSACAGTQTADVADVCGDSEMCCVATPTAPGGGASATGVTPSAPGGSASTSGVTPSAGSGSVTSGGNQVISFRNPLEFDTVEGVLGAILDALQGIIVTLALVFIVVGAVLYVTSAGNDKQIELAKNAILASMIGLALGIAAPSFLKEIATILGWGETPSSVSGATGILGILLNVLNFLLSILGVLAIIMLIIGGFMYLTSAGNDEMIDRGKKILIWSIVGVLVALGSLIIVNQIATFF